MAHAKAYADGAILGTKPRIAKRSFGWKFRVVVVMIVVAAISPWIPRLWGWDLGWIGIGHGSWSMAAHGGIMPGSIVYEKALAKYFVGDKISFEYKGSADPTQNGPSLKLVTAINSNGTYRVKGMNETNSIPPCDVKPEDIEGKVVWSASFMPELYWRWLSLGWTLNTDEIKARQDAIFSGRTVFGVFTKQGRLRNWAEWHFSHDNIRWGANGFWAVQELQRVDVYRGRQHWKTIEGDATKYKDGNLLISRRIGDGWQCEHISYSLMNDELTTALGNDWLPRRSANFTVRAPAPGEIDLRKARISPEVAAALDNNPETNWAIGPTDARVVTGSIKLQKPQQVKRINVVFAGDASVRVRIKVDDKVYDPKTVQRVSSITIVLEKGLPADSGQISEISLQKG